MKTYIDNALICDVKSGEFNGHKYNHLLVYSEGKLLAMKIKDYNDNLKSYIGSYHKVCAELNTFDNKISFKLVSIE